MNLTENKIRTISLRAFLSRMIWLCVLPLAVQAAYLAFDHVRIIKNQRTRTAADHVRNVMDAIDHHLVMHISALEMMAASPFIDDTPNFPEFYKASQRFHDRFGGHVILADMSMQMILNTRVPFGSPLPKLPVPKGRAAAPLAVSTGKPAVGDMFHGPIAREMLVSIVVPVLREGRTEFLIVNTLEVKQFQQVLDAMTLPAGWRLTLLDGISEVMARRVPANAESDTIENGPDGRFTAQSGISPWSVVLEIPLSERLAPVVSASLTLAAVILAVTFMSVLAGRLAGRKLSRSVAALAGGPAPSGRVITEIEDVHNLLVESAAAKDASEATRRESESMYRLLAENASDVIWILDVETMRFRYVSPSVAHLRGYSPEEVMNQDVAAAVTPESLSYLNKEMPARIEKYKKGFNEFYKDEIEQPHRNGTVIHTEVTSRYIANPATGHLEVVGVTRDITERKKAEQALKDSQLHLHYALNAAKAGSWEWKLQTNENIWSEELWALYGLEPNCCPPSYEAWRQTIHPDDIYKAETAVQEAVLQGTELNIEWRTVGKDGIERWLMSRGQPMTNSEGRTDAYIGIVLDITDRKRIEESLIDNRRNLLHSLEEKVSLLKEVHHRVKNNLQIVASLLALQANRSDSREVRDTLTDTRNRVRSMAMLHEALYRSENLAHINFSNYVRDLCSQLIFIYGEDAGRIRLENRIQYVGLPLEHAIPCGLIVNELVSNAIKHAFPEDRTGKIIVEFGAFGKQMLRLSVSDDGAGMRSDMDPASGDTLGLQLVTRLSDQLDGKLTIVPCAGGGTSFRVCFPVPENTLF